AGVLAEILVQEGQTVPVQTVVARLETEKGALVGAGAAPSAGAGAAAGPPPAGESTPAAAELSHPSAATPSVPVHAGNGGGNSFEDRLRTKSSPLVRKIAAEHGIELTGMRGSGIAGRVTKKDILEFIDGGGTAQPAAPIAPRHAAPAPLGTMWPTPTADPGDVVEPMTKMRALISDHMAVSRRTAAHVTSFMEIDFTRIARLRAARRAEFEAATGQKLTYLPFIIKAVVAGIKAFPV